METIAIASGGLTSELWSRTSHWMSYRPIFIIIILHNTADQTEYQCYRQIDVILWRCAR